VLKSLGIQITNHSSLYLFFFFPIHPISSTGGVILFVVATAALKTACAAAAMRHYYGFPWSVALAGGSTLGHISNVRKKSQQYEKQSLPR